MASGNRVDLEGNRIDENGYLLNDNGEHKLMITDSISCPHI